jgi:hypothetical protein
MYVALSRGQTETALSNDIATSDDGTMFLFWYSPIEHPAGSVLKVELCKRRGRLTINAICQTLRVVTYSVNKQRTINHEPSHAIYEYEGSF